MTVRFEGKVDNASMRRVRQAIATAPDRVYKPLRSEFERWGQEWERKVQDRFTGATGPRSLHGRTGNLQKSMSAKVSGSSLGDLGLRCVSAGALHARAQNYGAEIRPKKAKSLTIPIGGNLSAAGVPRYPTVGSLMATFPGRVFFLKRAGKNTLAMLKDARSGGPEGSKAASQNRLAKNAPGHLTAMFVLVKKVTLPGPKSTGGPSRLGFFDEWKALGQSRRAGLGRIGRQLGRTA